MKKNEAIALEAKMIVVLAFRNGPIEDVHAGAACPTCTGKAEISHITDAEMKGIMKTAVNRVFTLLTLKKSNLERYAELIVFGEQHTNRWDEPEIDKSLNNGGSWP